MKPKITGEMFLECYEEFKIGNKAHVPEGMNENSAKMTMIWLESLFSGSPYHRSGSALQYKLILDCIKKDYGEEKLQKAISVLMENCEWSSKNYNNPMIKHRKILNSY